MTPYLADDLVILASVFGLCVLGAEIGFSLARRFQPAADDRLRSHIGTIQASVLGLLALLLGFSFAMTGSRYESRRALALEEANAIGTTWLRARLLPEPAATDAAADLRRYVDLRLEWFAAGVDADKVRQVNEKTNQVIERLWSVAATVAAGDKHAVTTALFLQSLNEVIDVREKREIALRDRVPAEIFALLIVAAVAAVTLTGYAGGAAGTRDLLPVLIMSLLIAATVFVIEDLHRPRRGLIRESQQSLIDLRHAIDRGAP